MLAFLHRCSGVLAPSSFASMRFVLFFIQAAVLVINNPAAASGVKIVVDPVRDALQGELMLGTAIRLNRDVNNDAMQDTLVASPESCGQQGCTFRVYLRLSKRRFRYVGELNSQPFAFSLTPIAIGKAQWKRCYALGDIVSQGVATISLGGVVQKWRSLNETESEQLCQTRENYSWEECDLSIAQSVRSCKWKKQTWN